MTYDSVLVVSRNDILDIGGSILRDDIYDRLVRSLTSTYNEHDKPTLPDELLYDGYGLFIWNDIIMMKEFYQTHDEIALFKQNGYHIASRMPNNVTMIDLGAGDTRKVQHLLAAFEDVQKASTYLALDISKASLEQNVGYLARRHCSKNSVVRCGGLWGTFGDGMAHVDTIKSPRLFLSLGSVLCNDPWYVALTHLRGWVNKMRPDDYLLVGMDGHMAGVDSEKIWKAYHSCDDLYREFFLNGFLFANRLLGEEAFREEDWEFLAEMEETPTTRHRFFFRAKVDVRFESLDMTFCQGQEIDWFDSHKYNEDSVRLMCSKAGLVVESVWKAPGSEFHQYLLRTRQAKDDRNDCDSAVSGLE